MIRKLSALAVLLLAQGCSNAQEDVAKKFLGEWYREGATAHLEIVDNGTNVLIKEIVNGQAFQSNVAYVEGDHLKTTNSALGVAVYYVAEDDSIYFQSAMGNVDFHRIKK